MSFNWFDRNAAANPEAAPNDSSDQPQAPEGDTPTSEEMLTFAKQAYENLKKQKAAAAEATAVVETPSVETPAVEMPAVETPEAETPAEKPELYSPPPDDSGLPFWARADADREVRLARLRETAIETPEENAIEAETPRVRREIDPATLVPLDGDFLWSMEVLASQGRRADEITLEEITWLKQLRQGLDRTRRSLVNQLKAIVGQGPLNDDAVMEIESLLLQADVGVAATDRIIGALQGKLKQEVLPPEKAIAYLKEQLINLLDEPIQNQTTKVFVPEKDQLNIWLLTGVNGVGKTTTIGKLTHIATKSGYRCLIAAADTFRAAAVEQVKVWAARSGVDVIANPGQNTDPASVVFDAIAAAQSRNTELLLVDTAGRLQNKKNLMDELSKVRRIIDKKAPDAKIESLLVLDATLGQNGLQQAKVFAEAAQLSGVVLTKLDGTAKGGIALAVVQQLGLPIRFIGAGEGIEDLRPFSSYEFVEALISG
jgi:fused signal recognition particle receptor